MVTSVRPDVAVPVAVLVSRFEKRAQQLREDRAALPWWAWRQRFMFHGAIAVYQLEVEDLLETGSRHQPFWHNFIGRQPQPAPDRQRR